MNERFEVEFTRAAEKDLRALRGNAEVALRAILRLENQPELGHSLSGNLRGSRALEFNVKGSGAFRAVYLVDSFRRVCLVYVIGPHEGIYEKAERRANSIYPIR
ncbi:MAG: type II toxin-antitoxin system RelE/ParE family toxin [Thermomicrobiales bacterium]|nr:type II toxin-antitoxin system RelE/ParE family toxin [Thermomicrobiales bacterium]